MNNDFEYTSIKLPFINQMKGGANENYDLKSMSSVNLPRLTLGTVIVVLVIVFVVVILFTNLFNITEHMSGGTLTQMFAQDSQNTYLNSASPGIQEGDFNLFWNQPTLVTNPGTQRGVPLQQVSKNLPQTPMNPGYKSTKKQKKLDKLAIEAGLTVPCETSCSSKDPTQCGNSHGNICRMKSGFVEPTDGDNRPFVGLDGKLTYPDSYVGSLFIEPNNDIRKPLPYIKPMNPSLPYVKEGFE